MDNPYGNFIWYELMTIDADAAKAFYDPLMGWSIDARRAGDDVDYRMVVAGDGNVGGVLPLDEAMLAGGARPAWLGYVSVDDVDAEAAAMRADGGRVFVPPTDIPGVGRFAMLADPQGAAFYIMRPQPPAGAAQQSAPFDPARVGHVAWNELNTSDPAAAIARYGARFGWTSTESVDMGPAGEYRFINRGETRLGGVTARTDAPPHWLFYWHVPNANAAAERITAGGGTVLHGPAEVPGGSFIVIATDPQGAAFGVVGPA